MKISKIVLWVVLLGGLLAAGSVMAQNLDSVGGDRQALVDLYHATDGDNWENNSGWLKGAPSNDWYGVQVDGNGRVVKIKLNGSGFGREGVDRGNRLNGTLPESIGNLTRVTYFNVKQNNLWGEIPSSIGNMRSLSQLLLNGNASDMERGSAYHPGKPTGTAGRGDSSNNFSGSIPSSIGNLKNVVWIEMTGGIDHQLSGDVPSSIGALSNLEGLQLSFNNLRSLPSSMGNLTELRHLTFRTQKNELNGQDVSWLQNLVKLQYLFMQDNKIGGLHPDLSRIKDLRVYTGNSNDFTGPFPSYLTNGSLPRINMIQLAWNDLEGAFPEIKEPNNLTAFTIEGNNISGEIHPSWGTSAASKIVNFGVGWNNLEGEFPNMSHAYKLRYIRARDNNFTGPLPALHTDNDKLANLWFQNNNFSGPVDPSIAEAIKNGRDSFGDFNISSNRFCEEDLEELVAVVSNLDNGVSFRYGGQEDPICGGESSSGSNDNNAGDNDSTDDDSSDEKDGLNAPDTISPADQSEDVSLTPTFEWSDVSADYYILHANRTDPSEMEIDVIVEGTTFTVSDSLDPETVYHWRVRGVKDNEEGEWSSVREFETKEKSGKEEKGFAGKKPHPLAPEDKKKVKSKNLTFEWSDIEADEYILHVSREDKEGNHVDYFQSDAEDITISGTSYTVPQETLPGRAHAWRVRGVRNGVEGEWSEISKFETDSELQMTGVDGEKPLETAIHQNYPNPFNPSTRIEFALSELQNVSLRVYDMAGRQVATLVDGVQQAGHHTATFNANNLASGVYFYRFITETQSFTKKMTLVK